MTHVSERGKRFFDSGFCCAESVLKAVAEEHNITSELIPRIATGLCGGVSRTCGTCGAVSGGILAINMILGRDNCDQSVEENYDAVREFLSQFVATFGSINCQQLTGCDLGTPEGMSSFEENNLHERCSEFVGKAADIATSLTRKREQPY
jgi:C_GCAxxG_C_C family probable redox protein